MLNLAYVNNLFMNNNTHPSLTLCTCKLVQFKAFIVVWPLVWAKDQSRLFIVLFTQNYSYIHYTTVTSNYSVHIQFHIQLKHPRYGNIKNCICYLNLGKPHQKLLPGGLGLPYSLTVVWSISCFYSCHFCWEVFVG